MHEQPFYKLIWQVKEISYCKIHGVKLEHFCWQCKKKIPIISSESRMGYCPYCLADLSLTTVTEEKNNLNDRLYEDWKYLLAPNIQNTSNNLNINQLFALKLIYIEEYFNNHKTCDRLLQTARNSKSMETTTHLSIIFKIIRKANISIKTFSIYKYQVNL
ncbi:hypothetical protein KPL48_12315 [Clostridium estertheticum]|nr:hypothetical protein [Clostridium estertheticum]